MKLIANKLAEEELGLNLKENDEYFALFNTKMKRVYISCKSGIGEKKITTLGDFLFRYSKSSEKYKALIDLESNEVDMVNDPPHYKSKNGLEAIDVVEAFDLDFSLASAVKYILRSGNKFNEIEDLKKSIWFIDRKIKNLSQKNVK